MSEQERLARLMHAAYLDFVSLRPLPHWDRRPWDEMHDRYKDAWLHIAAAVMVDREPAIVLFTNDRETLPD